MTQETEMNFNEAIEVFQKLVILETLTDSRELFMAGQPKKIYHVDLTRDDIESEEDQSWLTHFAGQIACLIKKIKKIPYTGYGVGQRHHDKEQDDSTPNLFYFVMLRNDILKLSFKSEKELNFFVDQITSVSDTLSEF